MADHHALLRSLLTLTVCLMSVIFCIDEAGTTSNTVTHNLTWSKNVSTLYPPSSPLKVKLGDMLNISCPPDGTSNIWIQTDVRQYEMCDCNATGVENPDCSASTTIRQVCQDEVHIAITFNSQDLNSALSFESGTIYYLISYSPGNQPLAGYLLNNEGGECLDGYKMAMNVQSLAVLTTTTPPAQTTFPDTPPLAIATSDDEDLFTTGGDLGNYSLETSIPLQPTTQQLQQDHSTMIRWTGFTIGVVVALVVALSIVLIVSIISIYQCKKARQSWTLPGTHNILYVTNKTEAYTLHDKETKYNSEAVANFAYGTSSHQEVSMTDNAAYDTVHNQVLMSDNAAYGTSTFKVLMNENTAYGINTKLNDDGPVNDDVD